MASQSGRLPLIAAGFALAAVAVQALKWAPIGGVFAAAIYFITWWVVLFAVLPFGVRTQHDAGEVIQGTSAGAPVEARMSRVVAWTTIVASIVFFALLTSFRYRLVPLDMAN